VDGAGNLDAFVAGLDLPMFVVTTVHPGTGERAGCLIGFATQCSIDPDHFLACLSQKNHTYRVAREARLLAVHGLGHDQHELAALFGTQTGDAVDKFSRCAWRPGPSGVPILTDCPRWFVGEIVAQVPLGNHTGFLLVPGRDAGTGDVAPLMFSAVRDLDAGHPA
jgi:flavin reductase (DIM6/NTAB) family NADH-FMN oxidoreductase RutF